MGIRMEGDDSVKQINIIEVVTCEYVIMRVGMG